MTTCEKFIIKSKTKQIEVQKSKGLGWEIFNSMRKYKNKIMQIQGETEEQETYGQVLKNCILLSNKLRKRGINGDDRICICSENNLFSVVPYISCLFIGAKVTYIDPKFSLDEYIYFLTTLRPKIVFVSKKCCRTFEEAIKRSKLEIEIIVFEDIRKCEFDDAKQFLKDENFEPYEVKNLKQTAVIFLSSGSTGYPKGICLNHYGLLGVAKNLSNYDVEEENDEREDLAIPCIFTLHGATSLNTLINCIKFGHKRILFENFKVADIWMYIKKYKISIFYLPPHMVYELLQTKKPQNADTSTLKILISGGATISGDKLVQLREFFPNCVVYQGYGQTELSGIVTIFDLRTKDGLEFSLKKPNSCGMAFPGNQYKVVDVNNGNLLGPNQHGELLVKSPFIMNGYFNADSSSSFDCDGFFKTGDIVYYDEDDCFYHVDRSKEILYFRSFPINPAVLEEILMRHPSVKEAAVIGIPHPKDGDHPMGIVVLKERKEQISPEEIIEYYEKETDERRRLRAGLKIVKEFPLTATNKVKKTELRRMILSGQI